MRTVRRLRLRFLLLRPGSPNPTVFTLPCCPLCYSLPCRNHGRPIIKHTIPLSHVRNDSWGSVELMCSMVDLAGVEPASRTLFSLLHTAITHSIYLLGIVVNRAICPNNKWCQSDARYGPRPVAQQSSICPQIFSACWPPRTDTWYPTLDHCIPRHLCR